MHVFLVIKNMNNKISRIELNKVAHNAGRKYYLKYDRFELAEKLV